MPKSYYSGWEIPEDERARLFSIVPPKFPDVIAHHITHQFGLPEGSVVPDDATVAVVGVASSDNVQALVVEVNGRTHRPDGKRYHITWSLDRETGAKPVHSNDVIEQGWLGLSPVWIKVEGRMFS